MENLTSSIETIINSIMHSDPAVYRIIVTDKQGLEIASSVKHWNRKSNEEKSKNAVYPLLNSISNNSEKFLNFLRVDKNSPFIFTWTFDGVILFAASSPYGFIGVFCEPDVNQGLIKKLLKKRTIEYNQLVAEVFLE